MGEISPIPYNRFDLDLNADTYSPQNALSMALACQLSYQSEGDIHQQLKEWGFSHVVHLNAEKGMAIDTQGFVASNDDITLIAFRGSESLRDWGTNLNSMTDPGPFKNTRVHEGVLKALLSVMLDLTEAIVQRGNSTPLWLTGHSLGAALATILTGMYLERDRAVKSLYTFGSPRVGNEAFRTQFNARFLEHTYRVVNGNDFVPHTPSEPPFSHVGQLIIFDAEGNRMEQAPNFWKQLQIKFKGMLLQDWLDGKPSKVERHLLNDDDGYIACLLKDLQ